MSLVTFTEVETLNYEEVVRNVLNNNYTNVRISQVKVGNQPKDTFILGSYVLDTLKAPLLDDYSECHVRKYILKEINDHAQDEANQDNSISFGVSFFDQYIKELDICLQKAEFTQVWFALSNATICSYHQDRKLLGRSKFHLKVEKKKNSAPQIVIISRAKEASKLKYSLLNNVHHGVKQTLMAVVSEVVKEMVILKNKSKHTMLKLSDPSKSILLHVFFNKPDEYFPIEINVGDVVRVKDMLGEFFQRDGRMYGKIYSAAAFISYKESPEGEMNHYATDTTYTFTSSDKRLVNELRQWWKELRQEEERKKEEEMACCHGGNEPINPLLLLKRIEEVKDSMVFHLQCVVNGICFIDDGVILKVSDGTPCQAYTNLANFTDGAENARSFVEVFEMNSINVDVQILKASAAEVAKSLQVGDFVQMYYVSSSLSVVCLLGRKLDVLKFSLRHVDSGIVKLCPSSNSAQDIKRRLPRIEPDAQRGGCLGEKKAELPRGSEQGPSSRQEERDGAPASRQDKCDERGGGPSSRQEERECSPASHQEECDCGLASHQEDCDEPDVGPASHQEECDGRDGGPASQQEDCDERDGGPASHQEECDERDGGPGSCEEDRDSLASHQEQPAGDQNQPDGKQNRINQINTSDTTSQETSLTSGCSRVLTGHNSSSFASSPTSETTHKASLIPGCSRVSTCNNVLSLASSSVMDEGIYPSQVTSLIDMFWRSRPGERSKTSATRNPKGRGAQKREAEVDSIEQLAKRRKLPLPANPSVKIWSLYKVFTDCDPFPKFGLRDFLTKSQDGDVARVWAIVKHFHILSSKPTYQECSCELCFHNWIWGLCSECGSLQDSYELRKTYSKEQLRSNACLMCPNPTCLPDASAEGSVHPLVRLQLAIGDFGSDDEFFVHLNGDGANKFFGICPSFRWTVESVCPELLQKGAALQSKHIQGPLQLGLKKVAMSDGTNSFNVCGTKFRVSEKIYRLLPKEPS